MLVAAVLLGVALLVWLAWASGTAPSDTNARPVFSLALALPVLGLVLVEQLYRNATDDSRWSSKPFCLALALAFVFDIYFYSQAALFLLFLSASGYYVRQSGGDWGNAL